MRIEHSIRAIKRDLPYVVMTLGNFDGIHRGHQSLFDRVTRIAHEKNGTAVVLTFDPHPLKLLKPDIILPQITPLSTKIDLIGSLGIDLLVIHPFTEEFSAIHAEEFLTSYLKPHLDPKVIIVGENFQFGKNKSGNIDFLRARSRELDLDVQIVQPITDEQVIISSSTIRKDIQRGQVQRAGKFLGRPFMIDGTVVRGDNRGHTLGFPTANLETEYNLLPANGVYVALVPLQGKMEKAVVNIGYRPTFQSREHAIEVHLLDVSADLYGKRISLYFIERIRDERPFLAVDDLVQQIRQDIVKARDCCAKRSFLHFPVLSGTL